MTDSPSENEPALEQAEQKTVPVKAVAEVRARARTAEEALAQREEKIKALETELEQSRKATPKNDVDIESLIAERLAAALDQRLASIEGESQVNKIAREFGASEEQAMAVLELQRKYKGMEADKALVLARLEKPELFEKGFQPNRHGTLPPSGSSPLRSQNTQEKSYDQRIEEAKTPQERERISREEILKVVQRGRAVRTR